MRYKILYVDDEHSNLRIFKDTFRRDFEVFIVDSGSKALELINNTMVDLVITDQRMPEMTGVELLREITLRFDDLPSNRLILSGYAEDSEIQEAFNNYHLSKFISKPWDYKNLKEVIIHSIEEN
nr:response regulator [uncultured Carboxylicivirga sp.]